MDGYGLSGRQIITNAYFREDVCRDWTVEIPVMGW